MKNFALASLLAGSVSVLGAGCKVVSYDDGVIHAEVVLSNAGPGALGECQQFDAIRIITEDEFGDQTVDLHNCDETDVHSSLLAGGDYTIWLDYVYEEDATDAIPASVIGTTGTLDLTVDGDVDVAANIELDHGFLSAAWFLEDDGGNPLDCADVAGQNGIGILATLAGATEGVDTLLDCTDAAGFTAPLELGTHEVEVTLIDGSSPPLALGASEIIDATIENGNEYVDIGDVTVVVF
jgi:hypothetical protein